MAWLAVNGDGKEKVFNYIPHRERLKNFFEDGSSLLYWEHKEFDRGVLLPKGSIKKLTGKELTWKDEPIEFNEE